MITIQPCILYNALQAENWCMFVLSVELFKINTFNEIFKEYHRSVNGGDFVIFDSWFVVDTLVCKDFVF